MTASHWTPDHVLIEEENAPAELKDPTLEGAIEIIEGESHDVDGKTLEITNIDYDEETSFLEIYAVSDDGTKSVFLVPRSGIQWMAERDA
jgi:hypothetical protein